MIRKAIAMSIILSGLITICNGQENKNYEEINKVHMKFIQAFDSLDFDLFAGIHSKNLIRIPGGNRVIDYNTYMRRQKENFKKAKETNSTRSIDLRFIERVNNDSVASERGIYKYVRNKDLPDERISYGKFHVILVKEMGEWKFFMDYDSSENNTIDEEDFHKAFDMCDFEKF